MVFGFAIQKLLGNSSNHKTAGSTSTTDVDQALACISVRFPLDFHFSHPNADELVCKQIENHMLRLCTTATSGFEHLFTTVGSEPLLAEAATVAMTRNKKSLMRHLSSCMDSNCINLGE
jgi:hypothetical protein